MDTTKKAEEEDIARFKLWKSIRKKNKSDFFDPKKLSNINENDIFTDSNVVESLKSFFDFLYGPTVCPFIKKDYTHSLNYDECNNCFSKLKDAPYPILETTIEAFMKILQYIGFHADKNSDLPGATHDISHAHYASKCDIFVTNDKHLRYRVKAVYNYLGIPTKVMSFQEYYFFWLSIKN